MGNGRACLDRQWRARLLPREREGHQPLANHSGVVRPGRQLLSDVATLAEAHCKDNAWKYE